MENLSSPKTLSEALFSIQTKIISVTKDAVNPHFKNKYPTLLGVLKDLKPLLVQEGIFITQEPIYDENQKMVLRTTISNQKESIFFEMPLILQKNDMQGLGAAITYARRQSLCAFFSLGADDDDAEASLDPNARLTDEQLRVIALCRQNNIGVGKILDLFQLIRIEDLNKKMCDQAIRFIEKQVPAKKDTEIQVKKESGDGSQKEKLIERIRVLISSYGQDEAAILQAESITSLEELSEMELMNLGLQLKKQFTR